MMHIVRLSTGLLGAEGHEPDRYAGRLFGGHPGEVEHDGNTRSVVFGAWRDRD